MKPDTFVTAASVLFGFLFAGFWWTLNRELTFEPDQRHFKFGYVLLLGSMSFLAGFGIILPLRLAARANPEFLWTYRAVVLVIIGVFGYMLTELGHYSVFQRPKYTTWQEHLFFWGTVGLGLSLVGYWLLR
jgi:hypothetical protein